MARRKVQALKTMGEPERVETRVDLFRTLHDPRVDRTKGYPLEEVLVLVLAAVFSGVNHLTKIELFGNTKLDWLRTILPYTNGIPSHDTSGRVLGQMDLNDLEAMFIRWMNGAAAAVEGVVAMYPIAEVRLSLARARHTSAIGYVSVAGDLEVALVILRG